MRKTITVPIQEVILASKDNSMTLSRLVKKGELRKLSPRLYTTNLEDTLDIIVKRNVFRIVSLLFPDSIISHRSSLETVPTGDG